MSSAALWRHARLDDVCIPGGLVRGPFGGSLKKSDFVPSGYQVYEQRHAIYGATSPARYFVSASKFSQMKRFQVAPGDFIVSCSGTIGRVSRIPDGAPPGIINQALLKITVDSKVIEPRFFHHYFEWESFQSHILDSTQGGAMQNLVGMPIFRGTPISLPPVSEQATIADGLDDASANINALERTIAKREAIKQGMMQALLTGRTRLPGFTNPWAKVQLGNVAQFYKGSGLPKSDLADGGSLACIHYGELFTHYGAEIVDVTSRTHTDLPIRSQRMDVLMPTSDVTPRGLAKASAVLKDGVILGGDILIIRADKGQLYGPYLAQAIRSEANQVLQLVRGTTVFHLYAADMKHFTLPAPDTSEQEAICSVLRDAQAEIDLLFARYEKAKNVKQGMMQELLTGRTRLRVEVAA